MAPISLCQPTVPGLISCFTFARPQIEIKFNQHPIRFVKIILSAAQNENKSIARNIIGLWEGEKELDIIWAILYELLFPSSFLPLMLNFHGLLLTLTFSPRYLPLHFSLLDYRDANLLFQQRPNILMFRGDK